MLRKRTASQLIKDSIAGRRARNVILFIGDGLGDRREDLRQGHSVDHKGKACPTLLEQAKRSGLATGDVTTSEIQDAAPAVEVSHVSLRSCYGPVATTKTCPQAAA